jgi:hypothetical protein
MHFVPLTKAKSLAGEVGRRVRQGNHEVRGRHTHTYTQRHTQRDTHALPSHRHTHIYSKRGKIIL